MRRLREVWICLLLVRKSAIEEADRPGQAVGGEQSPYLVAALISADMMSGDGLGRGEGGGGGEGMLELANNNYGQSHRRCEEVQQALC